MGASGIGSSLTGVWVGAGAEDVELVVDVVTPAVEEDEEDVIDVSLLVITVDEVVLALELGLNGDEEVVLGTATT